MLESFGIQHLKAIGVGVNVKSTDDVPHDKISLNRPQALYVVPAQAWIKSQSHFKEVHRSEYKQRQGPDYVVPSKRPDFVRKPHKPHRPHKPHTFVKPHNGGVQPKKQVHMPDETFVMGLIHSGIPLEELQFAFSKLSKTRCCAVFGRCRKSLRNCLYSSVENKSAPNTSSVSSRFFSVLSRTDLLFPSCAERAAPGF